MRNLDLVMQAIARAARLRVAWTSVRLRVLAVAGRIIRTGRRRRLRLPRDWPWNHLIDTGWHTLRTA